MENRMQLTATDRPVGPRRSLLYLLLFIGMTSIGTQPRVTKAQGIFRPLQNVPSARFLDVPRALQQALREAEQAIEDESYSDAVLSLGEIAAGNYSEGAIGDLQGQDFFIRQLGAVPKTQPLSNSLLKRVRFLIGTLPEAAMETYELRYGPSARKLLSEAAASRDWMQTAEVRRRFFHTLAGYEASYVLSQRALLLGHPLEARLYLTEVISSPRAIKHLGRSAVLMYLSACSAAGQEPAMGRLQESLQVWPTQFVIQGESKEFTSLEELLAWSKDSLSLKKSEEIVDLSTLVKEERQVRTYPLLGGDSRRNASGGGQLPLSNERWRLSTTGSPLQERDLRQDVEQLRTSGKLPPPSWMPLRVGDQLLMRTTERLVGVDHRTGKRVWTYPWQLGREAPKEELPPINGIMQKPQRPPLVSQRVWNDLPYGQMSSDGERVYLLDQLGQLESMAMNAMLNMRGIRRVQSQYNTLVALELKTEGKLRWRLGAEGDENGSLANAFFLGPPLPLEGRLYVMAEIAGDVCLCCLDPVSGVELWRQQLVTVETGGVQSDPIRRVAGAMPTYHEGVLICPTGAGAVVGVDLIDRTLRWGAVVERNAEMYRSINGTGGALESVKLMQRWHNGVAIAEGSDVLVTPIESDRLYGFDLVTGQPLFPEKNRVQMSYLAGIRDGRFFVVGAHQIKAFDLKTGDVIWTSPRDLVSVGQQVSGLGVFGRFDYFLPTTTNEVIQVSLSDGTVRNRRETQYPLGNLLAVDGDVISQGPTSLSVAFGQGSLEPEVERRLSADPSDFEAIVRKAELLIQQGDLNTALDYLARARQMQPGDDEVRMLSVSAILARLRTGEEIEERLIEVLEALIDRPRQRVELLALQIRSGIKEKDSVSATASLLALSQLVASDSLLDATDLELEDNPTLQSSLDSWITARAQELMAFASGDELQDIQAMVAGRVDSLLTGSDQLLLTSLKHLEPLGGVSELRNELAQRMLEREDAVGLERLAWQGVLPNQEALNEMSISRLQMLAAAYSMGRMPKDELQILSLLKKRIEEESTSQDDSWGNAGEFDENRLANLEVSLEDRPWPKFVSLTWDARTTRIIRSLSQTQRFSELQRLAGEQMKGWRLYGEGSSPLSLMSPQGMRLRIAVDGDISEAEKTAQVSGGVMVVVTRSELIAVNLLALFSGIGDPVLWQRPISGDGGNPMSRRSSVTPFDDKIVRYAVDSSMTSAVIPEFTLGPVLGDRVIFLQGGDLIALDLITSETLWRNAAAPVSGAVVSDGERVAVISDATSSVVFFDPLDGEQLGTENWEGGQVWSSLGQNVLSYQPTEIVDQFKVQLTNPFSNEVLLEHVAAKSNRSDPRAEVESTFGRVESARYLNLLNNRGDALIWDLVQGTQVISHKFEAVPALAGLSVMQQGEQMILLPRAKNTAKVDPNGPQMQTSDGRYHVPVDRLHAVNLREGSPAWDRELESTWGCTITQPTDSPLLFLARSPFAFSAANRTRRKSMDVMAINVSDGKNAQLTEGRPVLSGNNQLETKVMIQQNGNRLLVEVGVEQLLYQFSDNPPQVDDAAAGNSGGAGASGENALQPQQAIIDPPSEAADPAGDEKERE